MYECNIVILCRIFIKFLSTRLGDKVLGIFLLQKNREQESTCPLRFGVLMNTQSTFTQLNYNINGKVVQEKRDFLVP